MTTLIWSKQDSSFLGSIPTYGYVNVEDAELYGIDAEATISLTSRLDVETAIAWVEGKDRDTNDHLSAIAPLNGRIGLRYAAPLSNGMRLHPARPGHPLRPSTQCVGQRKRDAGLYHC